MEGVARAAREGRRTSLLTAWAFIASNAWLDGFVRPDCLKNDILRLRFGRALRRINSRLSETPEVWALGLPLNLSLGEGTRQLTNSKVIQLLRGN